MMQVLQACTGACSYFEGLASQGGGGADFDCAYDAVMALHALVNLAEATAADDADRSASAYMLQTIRGARWAALLPSSSSFLLCKPTSKPNYSSTTLVVHASWHVIPCQYAYYA